MTSNMQKLTTDATKAGWTVRQSGSATTITKPTLGKKLKGIEITETGTAYDITVDLSVARGVRSYKEMRIILGLAQ
jgi:hypothetical protein